MRVEVNNEEQKAVERGLIEGDGDSGNDFQDAGDVRSWKKMIDPTLPSQEEIDLHELTHLPFRNWCRHCVKGCGLETSQKKVERDVGAIPEDHFDYCFLSEDVGADNMLTVLVARDRDSRMTLSEVVS